MEKPMNEQDLQQMETWEVTTEGTVHVHVKDPRERTGWRQAKVSGKGRKRLQISVEERLFNQELVPDYKKQHDPFTNGLLVRVSPPPADGGTDGDGGVSDDQLAEMFQIESDEVFQASLEALESEVLVRRLLRLAETKATMVRFQAIQNLVDERYHIGKTSRVVEEIYKDDERYAGADL